MTIAYVIIAALAVSLVSFSGGVFLRKSFSVWMKKNLKYLVTLALGVFAAVTFHLLKEVLHESSAPWFSILGWIALGVLVVEILSRLIPKAHHHHGDRDHEHGHTMLDARRMLLGDAFHNIGDGLLLVPAFLAGIHVGIFTAFAILVHELVQEISEFFVLKEAGYTDKQALGRNFAVSLTIFIGVAASLLVTRVSALEIPLLAFAAGGFIYIIFRDLLPHTISLVKGERGSFSKHFGIGILGILIVFAVNTIIPHEHEEEPHDEQEAEGVALNLLDLP